MKAAQIHLNSPNKRILYTFYTKSLYDLIKQLITRFYRHYKDSDPDWKTISILHAWGGANMDGVYYHACVNNGALAIRWRDVPAVERDKFGYVCRRLLESVEVSPEYDYILIDEGQDLPEHFFRLCFRLAAGDRDQKNIVWAYDELQNIFDVKVRTPNELFGVDENNEPFIDLERASANLPAYLSNDVVLHRSYRNPKEILICAHALGFALYSEQIVQMLENREHWEDIGYRIIDGDFTTGSPITILRPDENSPLGVTRFEPKDSIVKYLALGDLTSEIGWIVEQIGAFIAEGLRPEDILVISLDDRYARKYFAHPNRRSRIGRNRIFTAFTRTNLLPSLWISRGSVRSRLSPRCNVLSLIPWIRQNSPRDRPLVPNSPTSRWTSCRVRRRRGLT